MCMFEGHVCVFEGIVGEIIVKPQYKLYGTSWTKYKHVSRVICNDLWVSMHVVEEPNQFQCQGVCRVVILGKHGNHNKPIILSEWLPIAYTHESMGTSGIKHTGSHRVDNK